MRSSWKFGTKIAASFALALGIMLVVCGVSYRATATLAENSRAASSSGELLRMTSDFLRALRECESAARGFGLTGDERFVQLLEEGAAKADARYEGIVKRLGDDPLRQKHFTDDVRPAYDARMAALRKAVDDRRKGGVEAAARFVASDAPDETSGTIGLLWKALKAVQATEAELLERHEVEAAGAAATAERTIVGGSIAAILVTVFFASWLVRQLNRQVGSAVVQVRASTAELQATAAQQAAASKEHATTTTEVATTTKELLATTRQIADSAQRVAKIAEDTASAAQSGDRAVQLANDAIGRIKRQVDLVVTHMLDLGKKSQQIGGILEMINELAEQTNILAINATIESAGAGDAGKRFAVVADEIRKLADRVGGSSKEVRSLVDEIRAASNTTVMATEDGSKAVDAGTRQFAEVATSFRRIADLVGTTTDAAREIEISARQQTTAVEQVNLAITEVATVARDTESGSRQTLDASAQLVALARELATLVDADGAETSGARR